LFADIVGFTEFAAHRSAAQVLNILNGLFSEMDTLVGIHGVEKIKTIGDAYMAVSHTDEPALAKLALSMLKTLRRFNDERGLNLTLRIGLHSGPTIAGVIGHKGFHYDLWGDAVNIASWMVSAGVPGCIYASQALFMALQQGFEFEARGLVHLKGKGLLPTYFLLAEKHQGHDLQGA
jgi:class 3 adenylate cyclase